MDAPESEPDPCVVQTAPLAGLIREFVADWRRERPSLERRRARAGIDDESSRVEPVGPYEFLAADTGLPEKTIRHVVESTSHKDRVPPPTELRVAEALVASIGEPGMFYDGTFTVSPNPRCPVERRAAAEREASRWNEPFTGSAA